LIFEGTERTSSLPKMVGNFFKLCDTRRGVGGERASRNEVSAVLLEELAADILKSKRKKS
jgi:hypothetical protein